MENIINTLDLAQAELRSCYKRLNVKNSNVLSLLDETYTELKKQKEQKVVWKQDCTFNYTGYVDDYPIFSLSQYNEKTWKVFISFRGCIYDTIEKCKEWCEMEDNINMANYIINGIPNFILLATPSMYNHNKP